MTTLTPVSCVQIKVGAGEAGKVLSEDLACRLVRVSVDTSLLRPGMFELTFVEDGTGVVRPAGLDFGKTVQVCTTGPCDPDGNVLMLGEIDAIEAQSVNLERTIVVRGYDLLHRLQRVRRTRTFVNMSDSDIAAQIGREAGLRVRGDPSPITHDHMGQCNQSDWDFLTFRASEIKYELVISDGEMCFRKASQVTATAKPITLQPGMGLHSYTARVTAGNLPGQVEVRVWDRQSGKVVSHVAPVASDSAVLPGEQPAAMGESFTGGTGQPAPAAVSSLGPAPAPEAYVVYDRPIAVGAAIDAAGEQVARSVAERVASTFADGVGETVGRAAIQAGTVVQVSGMGKPLDGKFVVSGATHLFDARVGGYVTRFVVSGSQERSLLGLATGGAATTKHPQLPGVCGGIVTNTNDPDKLARVKVALPWLSPDYESDWAPVVQLGAGTVSGGMFLPEVGDQVLVAFEFADSRRPYVLGGVVNNSTRYSVGGDAVKVTGMAGQVVRRGFVSAAGNVLAFHDELPPAGSGSPATASDLVLGTGDGNLALAIDQTAGTVTITCEPAPPASKSAAGQITIQCGAAGVINIAAGAGGSVTVDGGDSLTLKAATSVSIESSGEVAVKGSRITLN